jgi:Flp pilus assembly protein TadG
MLKHHLRDNRGGALVELALVLPILTLLMVGGAELGRIAYFAIELTSAARAGAAYGSVNVANANLPNNIKQAAQEDATDITLTWTTPPTEECVCETTYLNGSAPTYSSTTPGSCAAVTGCNTLSATSSESVVQYVVVAPSATVKTMFNYPGLPTSYTLSGLAEMRILQN